MTFDVSTEFSDIELGDLRLRRRCMLATKRWAAAPTATFPKMVSNEAELQGLYGLLGHEEIDHEVLLSAHADKAVARIDARAQHLVRVIHDTTSFAFAAAFAPEEMGWLGRSQRGFFAHFALAVSADEEKVPLGVIGLSTIMRPRPRAGKAKKRHGRASAADPNRESLRWSKLARSTTETLRGHAVPIHIMDREGDSYATLSALVSGDLRFVIRVREQDRPALVDGVTAKVRGFAERSIAIVRRTATLSARAKSALPGKAKLHPPRSAREAKLEFAAGRLRLEKTKQHPDKTLLPHIDVNLVHVREVDPPADTTPVEWLLYTTEPVETAADVVQVVDHYRARWLIEEFFKAIKTGCAYERRQLESGSGLLIALALCVPVAWNMLLLRHRARTEPDAAASTVLTPPQLVALRAIARSPLPANPTAHEILLAVAAIGGHLKRNGPPGWQTIHGGMEKLLFAEEVLAAAASKSPPPPPG